MKTVKVYASEIYPLNCSNPSYATMVRAVQEELKPDVIVVTGTSGLIVAPGIQVLTGIPFCFVRKDDYGHHSNEMVEGVLPTGRDTWLIIDDLISTGRTVAHVVHTIRQAGVPIKNCLGVYLYQSNIFVTKSRIYEKLMRYVKSSPGGKILKGAYRK